MPDTSWNKNIALAIGTLLLAASVCAEENAAPTTTPAIPGVVAAGTRIELIKDGFTGTEGPVALKDGSVIFTETQANRITRIAADGTTSVFLDNSNGSNGLGFTKNGDLYAAQTLKPQVGIVYPPEHAKVLVDQFEGKPLGRPNDLVVSKKGNVYFTDPGAPVKPDQSPQSTPSVYGIIGGKVRLLAADIERPNGIQLSPNEKVLYVANTLGEYVFAYDIAADGSISGRRNFAKLAGWGKTDTGNSSGADGLAVDAAGRLYVASNAGIEVFKPDGNPLGVIALPKKAQNIAFAGPKKKELYIVGRGSAYKIALLTPGFAGRAK